MSRSSSSKSEGRVLPFQRPGSLRTHNAPPAPPVPDLEKYQHAPDEPDDYRHRMVMNGLGLAVTLALILAGLWMADVMAHMRKDQDCVLMGRKNCAPIDVPSQR